MSFADSQIRKLRAKLKPAHVKTREAEGISLHYLEGWHVVAEANRIFGFDGWDRESVTCTCVWTKQTGLRFSAAYVTRVRITVRTGDERIVREGCGAGESNAVSPGQAHEFAA
jgi:recombination DNA repair RAD52 pathway protein